ncbi:MAG: hypothetical protein ACTHM8_01925 [Sphingomonas sp.]
MRPFRIATASIIAASFIAATGASAAGPTRSAIAMPIQKAPIHGVRSATPGNYVSKQSDDGSSFLGYGLAAVVLGGVVAATIAGTHKDKDYPPAVSAG